MKLKFFKPRDLLDQTFEISLAIKAIHGLLELVGAGLLLAFTPIRIDQWVVSFTQPELTEEPHDFFARHLLSLSHHLVTGAATIVVVYLLLHGLVKIGMAAALLLNQLWAYPAAMTFLVGSATFWLYMFARHQNPWLLLLAAFDSFVFWLTWREYRRQKQSGLSASVG